jgi:hypothetical protein
MGSTPRRHSSGHLTTTSRRRVESTAARPWPVHARGSNGDATRANKLRAVQTVSLDSLAEPQRPAFAAAEAVGRALRDVGRNPIGVIGKQAALVANWLRQTGHDAQVMAAPGKKARDKRSSSSRPLAAIVALDCIEHGARGNGLRQIRRMLPSDGRLIAVVPNATHASVRLSMLLGRHPAFTRASRAQQHAVTAADAERHLREAGFTIASVERQIDSVDALTRTGNGVPEAVLNLLADDTEAMTSYFVFVAELDGAASTGRQLQRRLGELADEQRAVVIQAARLGDRVSDLEVRVRHWSSEAERIAESAAPASEAVALLETRLHQLASNQSELAATAAHASMGVDRIDAQIRAMVDAAAAEAERNAALREARDRCLARADEVAAFTRRVEQTQYRRLILRLRHIVERETPRGATVAVVTRGDAALLAFDGRRGWHFPQTEQGIYAGHHPADSAAAITRLEEVRARGARYLLIPRTAFWWLDYYKEFHQHLLQGGSCLARNERWGALFALGGRRRTR